MKANAYLMKALILMSAVAGLGACGLMNEHDALMAQSGGGAAGSGLAAFQRSVYPILINRCANCHGNGTGPQFAVEDVTASYSLSRLYVSFAQFDQSRMVQRTKDGHCGSDCSTDGAEMVAAIQAWWNEGEALETGGLISGNKVETPPQPIPLVLPTGTTYLPLAWDLAAVSPSLAGVRFQVEIQQFDQESYRVRNPRLTTAGFVVELADISVLVNGVLDQSATAYQFLHVTVPMNTIRTLTPSPMLILSDKGPGMDTLAFSFGMLKAR